MQLLLSLMQQSNHLSLSLIPLFWLNSGLHAVDVCMIHPVIDELAKQHTGKLKWFKLNTDESPSTATQYGIRSIPTVMIFKNGEKKDAVIGAVPKSRLTTSIEKLL